MMSDFQHKNTDLTLINDSGDLDLIRQYTEAYNKAYAEGDKAGQQAAHDAAEKIRAKYDYSGGVDGSEYIKLGTGASPAKADTSWLDSARRARSWGSFGRAASSCRSGRATAYRALAL